MSDWPAQLPTASGAQREVARSGETDPNRLNPESLFMVVNQSLPIVVIIGGGFGGLAAANALARTPAQVVLIDRNNHHLFQPLLYQVATSVLSVGHIGSPLRDILGKHKNTTVVMG